jgi:hypothetical protein
MLLLAIILDTILIVRAIIEIRKTALYFVCILLEIASIAWISEWWHLKGIFEFIINQVHFAPFFAVLLKLFRKSPRILTGYTFSHILDLMLPCFFSSLDHIIVNINEVNYSLTLVDSWWLIRSKAYLSVNYEVIVVHSCFDILEWDSLIKMIYITIDISKIGVPPILVLCIFII